MNNFTFTGVDEGDTLLSEVLVNGPVPAIAFRRLIEHPLVRVRAAEHRIHELEEGKNIRPFTKQEGLS